MPRAKKNGSPPVQRQAVEYKAKSHRAFARELFDIVTASAAAVGKLEDRHSALVEALKKAAVKHDQLDQLCMAVLDTVRPGRPPSRTPSGGMLGLVFADELRAKKVGRPPKLGSKFEDAVYRRVEAKRAELAAARKPATIVAALVAIADEYRQKTGLQRYRMTSGNTARFRAAYGRGKNRALKV